MIELEFDVPTSKPREIHVGDFYINHKNKHTYVVLSLVQVKIEDKWFNAVSYKSVTASEIYVRTVDNFFEKFYHGGPQIFKWFDH